MYWCGECFTGFEYIDTEIYFNLNLAIGSEDSECKMDLTYKQVGKGRCETM